MNFQTNLKTILILCMGLIITSCASHRFMRGTVAMKTDDNTAHICLGNNDVKVGDKVRFYNNVCKAVGGKEADAYSDCEMKEIGTGNVTKLLNSHYSEVKTNGNFKFKEGTLVQKM